LTSIQCFSTDGWVAGLANTYSPVNLKDSLAQSIVTPQKYCGNKNSVYG